MAHQKSQFEQDLEIAGRVIRQLLDDTDADEQLWNLARVLQQMQADRAQEGLRDYLVSFDSDISQG